MKQNTVKTNSWKQTLVNQTKFIQFQRLPTSPVIGEFKMLLYFFVQIGLFVCLHIHKSAKLLW